jgi:hypothetical protein
LLTYRRPSPSRPSPVPRAGESCVVFWLPFLLALGPKTEVLGGCLVLLAMLFKRKQEHLLGDHNLSTTVWLFVNRAGPCVTLTLVGQERACAPPNHHVSGTIEFAPFTMNDMTRATVQTSS